MDSASRARPVIALAMGDPCGISPELTAKVVALGVQKLDPAQKVRVVSSLSF